MESSVVSTDVAGRTITPDRYQFELRATDASGVPVELDSGKAAVWRAQAPGDQAEPHAVFYPLARPATWRYQARGRVLNRVEGHNCWSAWSSWTTATLAPTGEPPGPPAPTGVALAFSANDGAKLRPWDAIVTGNEVPNWDPVDDDPVLGATSYDVRLQISTDGTVPGIIRTRSMTIEADQSAGTWEAVFKAVRKKRYYRVSARARDAYGRAGAYSTPTAFIRPNQAVVNVDPGTVVVDKPGPRRFRARWDEPTNADEVDRYRVRWYKGTRPTGTLYDTDLTRSPRSVLRVAEADRGASFYADVDAMDEDGNTSSALAQPAAQTESGTLDGSIVTPGTLPLPAFPTSFRPIPILGTLPTLPSSDYPVGSVVFLTTDDKLYRNDDGVWTKAVDGSDLIVSSVTADKMSVTTLSAISANLGTVTAGTFQTGTSGTYWKISSVSANLIEGFATGDATAGRIELTSGQIHIFPPKAATETIPTLTMESQVSPNHFIRLEAGIVDINANLTDVGQDLDWGTQGSVPGKLGLDGTILFSAIAANPGSPTNGGAFLYVLNSNPDTLRVKFANGTAVTLATA